jgi:hypothetical protein
MKNITLAIDEDVLKAARKYAAKHNTTVNGMVREYLMRLATFEERAAKAREELVRLSETSEGRLGENWKWNRDELYDRPIFSRHQQSGVCGNGEREGGSEEDKGG